MSRQQYLSLIKPMVIRLYRTHNILPSIAAAQAILESGWGTSRLARPPYNNHFGVKAPASWTGRRVNMATLEDNGSGSYYGINADFRAYDNPEDSFRDYANNFTASPWLTNHYRGVIGGTNFRTVANKLQGTYATDTRYASKLINLITTHGLDRWDVEARENKTNDAPIDDKVEPVQERGTRKERAEISDLDYSSSTFKSPAGTNYIINEKLNDQFGFKTAGGERLWLEHYLEVDSEDPQEILKLGMEYMEEHSKPEVEYTVTAKSVPSDVSIGSTGVFVDHEFNPPLYIEARVLGISTSKADPDKNTITIGNVKEVVPQDKAQIIAIQNELKEVRANLVEEHARNSPLTFHIESEKGNILSKAKVQDRELMSGGSMTLPVDTPNRYSVETPRNKETPLVFQGKAIRDHLYHEPDEREVVEGVGITPEVEEAISTTGNENPQGEEVEVFDDKAGEEKIPDTKILLQLFNGSEAVGGEFEVPIYDNDHFYTPIIEENDFTHISIRATEPIEVEGVTITEKVDADHATNTELRLTVRQGEIDVTERFDTFLWQRVSNSEVEDMIWNDKRKLHNRSIINVSSEDLQGAESHFIVTVFDYESKVAGTQGYTILADSDAKSAYDVAVEEGFGGSQADWLESLRGKDGKDGIAGEAGADGRTPYTHIAYASSADGSIRFSTSDPTNRAYMGMYTDFNSGDSQDYTKYKWMLVKGDSDGKNLLRRLLISSYNASVDTSRYFTDGVVSITSSSLHGGARITAHPLQPNTEYVMRYKYKKTSGELVSFGGHTDSSWANNRAFVDGKEAGRYSAETSVFVADDNIDHEVVIYITTPDKITDSDYIYIQPNRGEEVPVSVDIYDWNLGRGLTVKDWTPAPEDTRDELSRKADAELTEAFLNDLRIRADTLLQEQEALATKAEVNDFMRAYRSFLDAQHKDRVQAGKDLTNALTRVSELENELGDMAVRWEFIDKEISMSEEGLLIGRRDEGTYLLQSDDRISFYNNGTEVAFISGGVLEITQAVFLRQIQIGSFIISEGETDHLTFRYVGDETHGV